MPYENTRRYESMLFEYGTVNRTDFRFDESHIVPETPTKVTYVDDVKPKPKTEKYSVKDTHTMSARKPIPFDLFIKPREIVRTNPRVVQKPFVKPENVDREEVMKTRPRLIISPAVTLDDIDNKEVRDFLIGDVYLTTVQKATREGLALTNYKTVRAPFPDLPAPAKPITLKRSSFQYVSPEWRMDSVSWDNRQLRSYCDPTRNFWLGRTPKCIVCDVTAARKAQKRIK